jgi:hypothetical protein
VSAERAWPFQPQLSLTHGAQARSFKRYDRAATIGLIVAGVALLEAL